LVTLCIAVNMVACSSIDGSQFLYSYLSETGVQSST
jgi:hypothetical protein